MWTSFEGGSSLVDASSAPSALEHRLGRLVDAGMADAGDPAPALGMQAQHVGRRSRNSLWRELWSARAERDICGSLRPDVRG